MQIARRVQELQPSGIRAVHEKALAMERAGEQVLHFEIGRPDFDTPDYIKQACVKSLTEGDVFYTSSPGKPRLREVIAEDLRVRHGLPYEADEILVTAGLSEAIFDVLLTMLEPGDEILVPDLGWMNYVNIPRLLGAIPVLYSLREDHDFQPDSAEIEGLITEHTKAIVLISPHNPTGSVLDRIRLEEIADLAIRYDLAVLSDEIYERIVYDDTVHTSIAVLPGMKERTITLNGFSKTYSMTGWRLGYVAAPAVFLAQVNKVHQQNTNCAASFVQSAAIDALCSEQQEVEQMRLEYERRRNLAIREIQGIAGLSCFCPQGAFYIFINGKELIRKSAVLETSADLAEYLLEKEQMAFVPGNVFGEAGEGYLRMSIASSYADIEEGCRRLKRAVRELLPEKNEYCD